MKTQKPLVGIGLVLFNHRGEIFTVREMNSKPQYSKKAGMISFPLETQEDFDDGDFGTVKRLIEEEMDIRFLAFIDSFIEEKTNFRIIPNRSDIITRYQFAFLNKKAPQNDIIIKDKEISFVGWLTPVKLFFSNLVRVEVCPILEHLFKNHHNHLSD
jgi:hypothetical protein